MQHVPVDKMEAFCLSNLNHKHLNTLHFNLAINIYLKVRSPSFPISFFFFVPFWVPHFQVSAPHIIFSNNFNNMQYHKQA